MRGNYIVYIHDQGKGEVLNLKLETEPGSWHSTLGSNPNFFPLCYRSLVPICQGMVRANETSAHNTCKAGDTNERTHELGQLVDSAGEQVRIPIASAKGKLRY
jgi:hypothetical protein